MSSHRYRTVVKRHHVRRREIQILVGAVVVAIVLALGFYLGQRASYSGMGVDPEAYGEMQAAVPVSSRQFGQLEHELDVSNTRNEVDRVSLEMVRREIAAQKKQILELEESLRFYRGLMAPEDIARGLILKPIELMATEADNRFTFRIVAQQEAQKHTLLKGALTVKVMGVAGEDELSFPLSALSENVNEEAVELRFRYFQSIEGVLVLPPDFQPKGVSMTATTTAPTKVKLQEFFPWVVSERFSYAGK
jgi:hypothetical protein